MKVLFLTVLLSVMQAAPPVPRQTPNSSARTGGKVQQAPPSDKPATNTSAATVNAQSPKSDESRTDKHRDENAEHSIRVSELRSVTVSSPKRDWADWGTWLFNLLLAITGGFQVWLLCKTLTFIRRQTHEIKRQRVTMGRQFAAMKEQNEQLKSSVAIAKQSAEATKRSIEMQISKERARITVAKPDKLNLRRNMPFAQVDYKVEVWAPTLAIIVETQAWAHISDSRDTDRWFSTSMEIESRHTRSTTLIDRSRNLLDLINEELVNAIHAREKFVHFYGSIKYRDAFQSEDDVPHETSFSYIWEVGTDATTVKGNFPPLPKIGERYLSEWVEYPPGSNKET